MIKILFQIVMFLMLYQISYSDCSLYVPKNLENSLITLEDIKNDSIYIPHGTGFLYKHEESSIRFIITNRHILINRDSLFARVNVIDNTGGIRGNRWILKLRDNYDITWTAHPDSNIDIAVSPFSGKIPIYAIPSDRIKNINQVQLSDPILFLGFPLLAAAVGNVNYPLVRSGIVSFITRSDLKNPYTNSILVYKDHLIIEGTVMSGNSGSPVLSCPVDGNSKISLIGVMSSHLFTFKDINSIDTVFSGKYEKDYGLGICIPAERINETIDEFFRTNIRFRTK